MCNCTNKPEFQVALSKANALEKKINKIQAVYQNNGKFYFGDLKAIEKMNICGYFLTDGTFLNTPKITQELIEDEEPVLELLEQDEEPVEKKKPSKKKK